MAKKRRLPRKFTMPWGGGMIVDEVGVETEYNEVVIQLLRYADLPGDTLRFCQYWLDGRFQRQPTMIKESDLNSMRDARREAPEIKALLKRLVED